MLVGKNQSWKNGASSVGRILVLKMLYLVVKEKVFQFIEGHHI